MRLLAALTLLISVSISSQLSGRKPEMQWEYEVTASQLLPGSSFIGIRNGFHNREGGFLLHFELTNPRALNGRSFVILTVRADGSTGWVSALLNEQPRIVLFQEDVLVYRFSSSNGSTEYFSVDLTTRIRNEDPILLQQSGPLASNGAYGSNSFPSGTFYRHTAGPEVPDTFRYTLQKWVIPSTSPQLAGSSFGLEDGNLIISWPTTAGQTYQVQRSTDLQSWENIGVALTGNGTTMSYSQPSNAAKVFLRVVIP